MSIAMISDVTTDHNRSKGLALVGIAFALGFTVGPPLGAFFSAIDLNQLFPHLKNLPFHQYSFPAVFAFVLILIETFYMYLTLPETVNFKKNLEKSNKNENENDINVGESKSLLETKEALEKSSDVKLTEHSGKNVNILSFIHFFYLFFFSGMEFTLTFLTYDRFQFTNMSQGTLLGFIGILSALVQGGYVRRVAHKSVHERSLAIQGVLSCGIGLGIIALVAKKYLGQQFLFVGASFLAFTSGTVVSSLTALASFESKSSQGKNLGKFRAFGQLGRSVGPIFSSSIYWVYGGVYCYSIGSVFMLFVTVLMIYLIPSPGDWKNKEKVKVA
ncbi:hypothetical protein HDU92_001891 [Lobulomyces angularis]|nr:hypothetical protein HDU92_001891 [Lobulomyces angularis]